MTKLFFDMTYFSIYKFLTVNMKNVSVGSEEFSLLGSIQWKGSAL